MVLCKNVLVTKGIFSDGFISNIMSMSLGEMGPNLDVLRYFVVADAIIKSIPVQGGSF